MEAEAALRKLEEAGFGPDQVSISTPPTGRRGNYGRKVLTGIAIGTVVGAVLGAVIGLVPGLRGALLPGSGAVAVFVIMLAAGAGAGGVAGALVSMAASGDTALYYEQEVQAGRFLVTVAGPGLDLAVTVMRAAGAMEAAPIEAPIHDPGRPRAESG